jgi:hypothetical protein
MTIFLTKYKFFIYLTLFLFIVRFSDTYKYQLIYPLLLLILILVFEFKKENFIGEKINMNIPFFRDFLTSLIFCMSIYVFLYAAGVFVISESYEGVPLNISIAEVPIIVVLGPLIEELFFRKLYFINFKNIKIIWMTLLNGFVFSVAHVFSDTPLFNAFIFGCCFFVIYVKTRKIIIPIILHIFLNFLVLMMYSNQNNIVSFVKAYHFFTFTTSFFLTIFFFNFYMKNAHEKNR